MNRTHPTDVFRAIRRLPGAFPGSLRHRLLANYLLMRAVRS